MKESSRPTSRWRFLGLFGISYFAAVLLTVLIFSVVSLRSDHFDLETLWAVMGFFPGGMFVLFLDDADWAVWVGYVVYILLAAAGVALRNRTIWLVFTCLLLVNIAGCCRVLHSLEENGWNCRGGSPTRECMVFVASAPKP